MITKHNRVVKFFLVQQLLPNRETKRICTKSLFDFLNTETICAKVKIANDEVTLP